MKHISPVFAVFLFAFAALFALSAQAQENHPESADEMKELKELTTSHPELKLDEDKTLLTEPEVKPTVSPVNNKEAQGRQPKAKNEKEEDDALGFNFLYYIIQKFKISDIVDN
jgi:negative regulator of genetic competence, sporulation and motility